MKKAIVTTMIVLFVSFLATAGTAFAKPPEHSNSNSQGCNASDQGKEHANPDHSVPGSCDEEPAPDPAPTSSEEPTDPAPTTTSTTEPQPSATCDGSDPFNPACM